MDKRLHVIPHKRGWAVCRRGAQKALKIFETREEAVDYATRRRTGQVVIHRPDGTVEKEATDLAGWGL